MIHGLQFGVAKQQQAVAPARSSFHARHDAIHLELGVKPGSVKYNDAHA
jgi:hypothetical protein